MKKNLFVFAAFALLAILSASAENDKVVNKNELPAQAQHFINEYFPEINLAYAKLEREFIEHSYEVVLTDGTKLEFSDKGTWVEVDCKYSEVPSEIIPAPIKEYIEKNYPRERVFKIERDRSDYKLKLSNRLELTFNKKFKIIDIDD